MRGGGTDSEINSSIVIQLRPTSWKTAGSRPLVEDRDSWLWLRGGQNRPGPPLGLPQVRRHSLLLLRLQKKSQSSSQRGLAVRKVSMTHQHHPTCKGSKPCQDSTVSPIHDNVQKSLMKTRSSSRMNKNKSMFTYTNRNLGADENVSMLTPKSVRNSETGETGCQGGWNLF